MWVAFFMFKRFILLGLVTLLALIIGFVDFRGLVALDVVRYAGYWVIALCFALFVWQLAVSLKGAGVWRLSRGEWIIAIAIVLGGSSFLHIHEEHGYKIVADEIVLALTGREMHEAREAVMIAKAYEYAGDFVPMVTLVDKRPLFFPFLLSLLHDLTGYRPANSFVLNALITVGLLGAVYFLGRYFERTWGGFVAVLLLCSIPLISQNATGGGFDLLNLLMIALTLGLGLRYAAIPNKNRLGAFVLSGVLLAQVRYESVLFIFPMGISILYIWWRERRIELPWPLLLSPLLLVMYPIQHNVFIISESTWQLGDVAGATTPFSVAYFYDNAGHAMNFFLSFDGMQPSCWWLGCIGMLALGFWGLNFYKHHRDIFTLRPMEAVLCIFILSLMLHTLLMLCYFWGKWDDPVISRLSLPFHLLLILVSLYTLSIWPKNTRAWGALACFSIAGIFTFTLPAVAQHRYTQKNFAARSSNWVADYIQTLEGKSVLAIDDNVGLEWFLYGKSCITPESLAGRCDGFLYHFKNKSFDQFIVVQRASVDTATGKRLISLKDDLGPGITLELIQEKAFAPQNLIRISRIVGVDSDKLHAWAKERLQQQKLGVKYLTDSSERLSELALEWLRSLP